MSSCKSHCVIFDVAMSAITRKRTQRALANCALNNVNYTVITADKESWQSSSFYACHNVTFGLIPNWVSVQSHSTLHRWTSQLFVLFMLLWYVGICAKRDLIIGISNPHLDRPLYQVRSWFDFQLTQFVQEKFPTNAKSGEGCCKADRLFYLPSLTEDIIDAIERFQHSDLPKDQAHHCAQIKFASLEAQAMLPDLCLSEWPSQCQYISPKLFWNGSSTPNEYRVHLIESLKMLSRQRHIQGAICYTKKADTCLRSNDEAMPVTPIQGIKWFENTPNIDALRSQCNILLITPNQAHAEREVLLAMAAGMCIVMPKDNSYWDNQLIEDVQCIKYQPQLQQSLVDTINTLLDDCELIYQIGLNASELAHEKQSIDNHKAVACHINKQLNRHDETIVDTDIVGLRRY